MSPEEVFECALQQYERACAEYKIATQQLISTVGPFEAAPILEKAVNRICRVDSPPGRPVSIMPQGEVDRRARLAVSVVDVTPMETLSR